MKLNSLRIKLIIIPVLILLLAGIARTTATSYLNFQNSYKLSVTALYEMNEEVGKEFKDIQNSGQKAAESSDLKELLTHEYDQYPRMLEYIVILNPEGYLETNNPQVQEGFDQKIKREAVLQAAKTNEKVVKEADVFNVVYPIRNDKNELLGIVVTGLKSSFLWGQVIEVMWVSFVPFIVISLLGVGVFIYVSSSIIRDLKEIEEGVNRIVSGKAFVKFINLGVDEIGRLKNMLNLLSDRVTIYFSELEDQVAERTGLLEENRSKMERQMSALTNILEDLQEERKLRESQSQSLLSTMGEGIVVTDQGGRVMYVNPAFEQMTKFTSTTLLGRVFSELVNAYDLKGQQLHPSMMSDAAAVTAQQGETQSHEMKVFIENPLIRAEKKAVVINANPIYVDGKFKGLVRIFHDFSTDFQLQQQKDDFFSIASHELRTPLTVIAGNMDMLKGYTSPKLSVNEMTLVEDSIEAADRLIKLVNDFLNVSRLDQGRLKYEMLETDFCKVTADVIKDMTTLAELKNLYLKSDCEKNPVIVMADPGLLREVLTNLIGNSIKFTNEGGITVELKVEGNNVVVRVRDTGVGIAKDKQSILFQRFQQARERTINRQAGGTGLGLYISREFVRVMGGELYIESSDLGKGSVFAFTLPLAKKLKSV